MKKNAKRSICKLLIIALILAGLPGMGMVETAYGVELVEIEPAEKEGNKIYPSSFDLRDRNVVTSVKNQGAWSTCWGFSAIAASEISLLSELTEKEGYEILRENPDLLDLSERHLAWFGSTPLPLDNTEYPDQAGEGLYAAGFDYETGLGVNNPMNLGGTFVGATTIFSSGIGPMYESEFPYKNEEDMAIALNNDGGVNGLWEVHEGNIEEIEEEVKKEDGYLYCYATRDSSKESGWYDWSIDESHRFGAAFELAESNLLPSPAETDENGKYRYNEQATLAIKDELMQGRGVSIMFCGQSGMGLEGEAADYINIPAYAQYSWSEDGSKLTPNHGVCIVGWDDNYPKSNFIEGHQPPADGAWIIKNSYGAWDNQFPGKFRWGVDDTGYFYVSYYDMGLDKPETFDFDTEENFEPGDAGYFIIDQYDLMPLRFLMSESSEEKVKMANVFSASEDEILRSVSVETITPGTAVTLDIYLLDESVKDPEDGELLETLNMTYKYGGYHRTNLEKGLYIPYGRSYSIVATLSAGGKYEYLTPVSASEESAEALNLDFYAKSVINENESFLFSESEGWKDWAYKSKEILEREDYSGTVTDNFGLKGYCDPATMLDIELNTVNDKNTYRAGDEVTFSLNITNLKDYDIHNVVAESSLTDLAENGKNLIEEIPAGEAKSITYTYTLTSKDISNGQINEDVVVSMPDNKNFEPVLSGVTLYLKSSGSHGHSGGGGGSSAVNYILTFDTNGGSVLNSITKSANTAVDLSPYRPTRDGYTFEGWYSDEELTRSVTSVTLTANTTVYAKWIENEQNNTDNPPNQPDNDNKVFTDVAADAYYANAVNWAVNNRITTGKINTEFAPDDSCTRAQMLTFLWRAAGSPEPADMDNPFTDVDMSAYYGKAVLWAVEQDITTGMTPTEFGPDEAVTRAQTVTFIYRAGGQMGARADIGFTDVDENAYYADAVSWAVANGITKGVSDIEFGTDQDCTRAQIVTLLYRWKEPMAQ